MEDNTLWVGGSRVGSPPDKTARFAASFASGPWLLVGACQSAQCILPGAPRRSDLSIADVGPDSPLKSPDGPAGLSPDLQKPPEQFATGSWNRSELPAIC
ncbi:MAG: hypothetical protein ACXWE4_08605 [Methylobacter sp.]